MTIEFVEFIPADKKEGVLYVSMLYALVIHLCPCGCGNQAVTPIGPDDWTMTIDDNSAITLSPSLANRFPCKSHYFIRQNNVVWA